MFEEEQYLITAIPSTNENVYYVALTPLKETQVNAQKIQLFMIMLMVICLTIGVFVAYELTTINYKPFKEVIDSFGEYDRRTYDNSEYEWLLEQKQRFYEEYKKAKCKISEKEEILRQQYLYHLLALPYDSRYYKEMDFSKDKLFEHQNTIVALFYLRIQKEESVYEDMDRSLIRFVCTNALEELLGKRITFEFVDMIECLACIINTDKESDELRDILEENLEELQKFLMKNMQLSMSVAFGGYQTKVDGVSVSYRLAREASEYLIEETEFSLVWYEDIKNKHRLYQYTIETEEKIINAIRFGQNKDVCTWIEEVIVSNYRKRELTQLMRKCLVYEIVGTIIKGAEQCGNTEFIIKYIDENLEKEQWETEQEVISYLHGMVNGLCLNICSNEKEKREDSLFGNQVMKYVQQNFHNPDLNISITALHFGITPSYLSTLFREQTGLNLLEYINHTRVEKAKELLEKGCSLAEVCDKTGFRNSGALIRVFKKMTGITPGQMKKLLGQHKE